MTPGASISVTRGRYHLRKYSRTMNCRRETTLIALGRIRFQITVDLRLHINYTIYF